MKLSQLIICLFLAPKVLACHALDIRGIASIRGTPPQDQPLLLQVQLTDTSIVDAKAIILDEKNISITNLRNIPFTLTLPTPPKEDAATTKRTLTIRATVLHSKKMLFRTMQSYPVDIKNTDRSYRIDLLPLQ